MRRAFLTTITCFILSCVVVMNICHTNKILSMPRIVKTKNQAIIAKATDTTTVLPLAMSFAVSLIEKNPYFYFINTTSVVATTLTCKILKHIIQEPRPDDKNDKKSFPSGHSTLAFAGTTLLFVLRKKYKMNAKTKNAFCTTGLLLALFTAIGRVLANRHWPIDVVCGSLIGIIGVFISYAITEKMINKIKKATKTEQ